MPKAVVLALFVRRLQAYERDVVDEIQLMVSARVKHEDYLSLDPNMRKKLKLVRKCLAELDVGAPAPFLTRRVLNAFLAASRVTSTEGIPNAPILLDNLVGLYRALRVRRKDKKVDRITNNLAGVILRYLAQWSQVYPWRPYAPSKFIQRISRVFHGKSTSE